MIISHRHRFIFFAIPKTGTHAVRRALRAQLGPEDMEQVGMFEQRALPYPEIAALRHGHISARQIRPAIGDAMYKAYFKFAFVRNPFDRFVSYCSFVTRNTGEFERDPRAAMKYVIKEVRPVGHVLYRPQYEFLIGDDGTLQMDMLCRQETMQQSYDAACARIGIGSAPLERVNATKPRRSFREYYDDELIALISDFYRDDLRLFGYTFDEAVR